MKPSEFAEKYAQQSDWFSTKLPGKYRIRVVSEFYDYEKAPFKEGQNPRTVFFCYVIDRAEKELKLKLYEMPLSVMKRFAALATDEDWKFESTPSYDINITKISTGPLPQNVEYQITPCAPSPLSPDEVTTINEADPVSQIGERLKKKEADKMGLALVNPTAPVTSEEVPPPSDEDFGI